MSRILAWSFAICLVLLVAGLFTSTVAPASPAGPVLVIVGAIALAGIAVAVFVLARRAKGWYRVTPRGK